MANTKPVVQRIAVGLLILIITACDEQPRQSSSTTSPPGALTTTTYPDAGSATSTPVPTTTTSPSDSTVSATSTPVPTTTTISVEWTVSDLKNFGAVPNACVSEWQKVQETDPTADAYTDVANAYTACAARTVGAQWTRVTCDISSDNSDRRETRRRIQVMLGVTADGIWGPRTQRAWEERCGPPVTTTRPAPPAPSTTTTTTARTTTTTARTPTTTSTRVDCDQLWARVDRANDRAFEAGTEEAWDRVDEMMDDYQAAGCSY